MNEDNVSYLDNVKIVLVETSHTGNMGSAARAMKTMGLTNLCLVNPVIKPDSQSISLAAGASDIIKNAQIFSSLEQAIADCTLVIGTSARSRSLQWPHLTPKTCGDKIIQEATNASAQVALVFGRERVGLTNEELQKCHYHVGIPANPDYSSLNLAMSVQVLCYEIRMSMLNLENNISEQTNANLSETEFPIDADIERFYQHLEQTLLHTGFINANHPGQIMGRLRRLFTRARIEQQELNILRGILTSIDKTLR
ncbi:tRNA (cytosine(32)/uridine(32)-2'-O)-methyltransferase TrmJ [Gilliamella sp. ESL0250]|uniref:tRNA (cytosine(32)/uridine(32)-2'-O)-methyltransferase TrmJ n=1 Tax=Gilliamella sp. ESL0250 TaxID=2705036 RepID=UPI0015803B02|nr:tRNA (cytosine(32)/uridine(32)-2'-O)-methyltransferase TrmJ [Gilliamella sp. ESL0250]NUF49984.1 tRNA (cytosine(32)/uridine(32)-2'-O)-methyltransferase TrmJ [Gilliamella sp. ESL0250]